MRVSMVKSEPSAGNAPRSQSEPKTARDRAARASRGLRGYLNLMSEPKNGKVTVSQKRLDLRLSNRVYNRRAYGAYG